uniref:response regulator n=1 Tax=Thaumasiovibrio occultus TaxID=1891184 RepID=UPI000B34E969|nr:response regulator [Thaumasiovibrio occultus]
MFEVFEDISVLVVDDAPPILSVVKIMLAKAGVKERNIVLTKSAKLALAATTDRRFDVIIADFNLGEGLNGKQFYEELIHYGYLNDDAVFMLVSGDRSAATIRPIIELRPDEYLLKPFTAIDLKQRILKAINRKRVLAPLCKADRELEAEYGLKLCDEIQPFNREYFFEIEQFRTTFLSMLSMHDEAKKSFEMILDKKQFDWAKLGLANSLTYLGDHGQADEIINGLLNTIPNSTCVQTEAAKINLIRHKIPTAISHLSVASKLTPGNSERELVIANLCLSVEDYTQALHHYRLYIEINKQTFRNNMFSKINLIRSMLYFYSADPSDDKLLEEIVSNVTSLEEHSDGKNFDEETLILAHLSLIKKDYRTAMSILKEVYAAKSLRHFYDLYHFAWLLNFVGMEEEFKYAIEACLESLRIERSQLLMTSKIAMAKELKQRNSKKKAWISQQYEVIKNKNESPRVVLETCIMINKSFPLVKIICVQIIALLTKTWPDKMGGRQVLALIERCDTVIRQLYSEQELKELKYQAYYDYSVTKAKRSVMAAMNAQ